MSEIPKGAMVKAEAIYEALGRGSGPDAQIIARALMAERERCASVAERYGGALFLRLGQSLEERSTKHFRDKLAHKIEAAETIAAAIRALSDPE